MGQFSRIKAVHLVVPVILVFFFLALDSMVGDSPTMDEQNHLGRGLALLRSGDPRFSLEHPPLVNLISAIPLLSLDGVNIPFDHPSWNHPEGWYAFSEELLWNVNNDVTRMIFLSRMVVVYMTLALALVGYRFGIELWRKAGALLVFFLLLFDPNILAHGRYITTDIGGSLFIFLTSLLLWRLWTHERWHWGRLAAAGIALGLALSSKMSNLVFGPIFILLAVLPLYRGGWSLKQVSRRLAQLFLALVIALPIIWILYAFQWSQMRFTSDLLSRFNNISGPMPTYWAGIERITLLSSGGRANFLLGETSTEGWWYYFPVAFGVKTPLILTALIIAAAVLLVVRKRTRGRAFFLLIPVLIFFVVTMLSGLNIGYRHLIPILPFCYVLVSGITVVIPEMKERNMRITEIALMGAVVILIATDLIIHPSYLSYFNVLAGGPDRGHRVLVDSNIDWGQDLLRLKRWLAENEIDDLRLAWFGSANPEYYNIDYEPLPGLPHHFDLWWNPPFNTDAPEPGTYAISVSNLWEIPLTDKSVFSWFRDREPDAKINYSIFIYHVE